MKHEFKDTLHRYLKALFTLGLMKLLAISVTQPWLKGL